MPGIETGRINYLTTGFHKFGSIIYFEVVAISNEKRRLLNCPTLREKCPNTEFFSVPYFPPFGLNTEIYSVLSVFRPNAGKYGPEKTPHLSTFHAVLSFINAGANYWEVKLITYFPTTNSTEKLVRYSLTEQKKAFSVLLCFKEQTWRFHYKISIVLPYMVKAQ